ncbi:MAG TPA: hypothetical protein VK828_03815 [Terriglobales bacterium]|nr:hypothetical protein [Terriglobales bacterium]
MRAIYLLIVLSLFSSLFFAEEIQLKDGSKVTGKIIAVDGNIFQVKTAYGEIKVPRPEIVAIQFPENSAKKDGSSDEAASQVSELLDGTLYSNRTAHFQVTVPAGWVLAPELRQTKDVVAALKAPDQAHFFMVTPELYTGSLATYRVLAETQFQSKFDDYQKLSESDAKLDGRTGLRLVWKGKTRDSNIKGIFLVYILPYDDRMVRLSFYTLEPLFDDAVPIFEKIATSYHSTSDKPVAKLIELYPGVARLRPRAELSEEYIKNGKPQDCCAVR